MSRLSLMIMLCCLASLACLTSGCATMGQREATVARPDGSVYRVRCQSDGALKYKDTDVSIEVDNHSKDTLGQALTVLTLGALRTPEAITK